MKKDVNKTIRVNSEIMKTLEREGFTAQKLFDWAIQQKISVETKIRLKKSGDK